MGSFKIFGDKIYVGFIFVFYLFFGMIFFCLLVWCWLENVDYKMLIIIILMFIYKVIGK